MTDMSDNLSDEARATFQAAADELVVRGETIGQIIDGDGRVCAIGALALGAGVPQNELEFAYTTLADREEIAVLYGLLDVPEYRQSIDAVWFWFDAAEPSMARDAFLALAQDDVAKASEIIGGSQ